MESKAAFVRSKGRIELHAEATVDLDLAFVVFPSNTELDDSFWHRCDLESLLVVRILFEKSAILKRRSKLCNES